MTALTRHRGNNPHQETWHIDFGDVRIGTIDTRASFPVEVDQWGWSLGFYPGLEPGAQRFGAAAMFEDAREAFDLTWQQLEPTLTDDYERWRRSRDFHAGNIGCGTKGHRMPTQNKNG